MSVSNWAALLSRLSRLIERGKPLLIRSPDEGRGGRATRVHGQHLSASYLIALAARMIREVSPLPTRSREMGERLRTLSLDSEIRFRSAADCAAFRSDLVQAIAKLVSHYHDESACRGRAHRLVVVAHALPHEHRSEEPT